MTEINAQDIEAIVTRFDESNWDELRVIIDGFEIYLSKKSGDRLPASSADSRTAEVATLQALPTAVSANVGGAGSSSAAGQPVATDFPEQFVVVRAPNLGTFYRSPKPGAPPYVSVGQPVDPDTEICLIEVMKLFTSVSAGVRGTVRRILAEDSQLVEFDQPLFLVEPRA
jgi:acetyl-CoA carboxylase biotin carboxyl carrier protein